MQDDKLPAEPGEGGPLQPADPGLPARYAPPSAALSPYEEPKRADEDEIDLLAYWRMLVKHRWLIIAIAGIAAVLAVVAALMTTPLYRATALMQIEREGINEAMIGGMPQFYSFDWNFQQTQQQLLSSRALAERTASRLNLTDPAARPAAPASWSTRLKGLLQPEAAAAPGEGEFADPETAAEDTATAATDPEAALNAATGLVQGRTTIEPVPDSSMVRIHYVSHSPQFAARVANTLAEEFIASSLERRLGASSYAQTYLEEQLALNKARLEESERELVAFAQKEDLILGAGGESLVGQSLASLNAALATAQQQRIRAQARWQQAQAASGAALPPDMLGDSILRTLQQERAQLQGRYREQLQVYKPEYPSMLQLSEQIEEVEGQISAELARIRASVRAEYDAAQQQEELLLAQLGQARDESLDVDQRSIQYNILRREVDTNRELYDALLQRYKEVGVASNLGASNINIVDRAMVPSSPFTPNLVRNLAIGLFLGLVLGVLVALVREFLDDTVKTPEDIEQRLRLPVLGVIPKVGRKQTTAAAAADLRSPFSEAYRSVRTALQFSTDRGVPRVLLITSASPSEGKSTTALELARNFAKMGKKVLLVEADMRNPSLHRALDVRSEFGLSSLLAGAAGIRQVVLESGDENLEVVLAGPLPPNPPELLSGSRMLSMLSVAAEKYDQVIIDGPPVLGIADAPILANISGGTLLVIHAGSSRTKAVQNALKRLAIARANVLGGLLTHYDARAEGSYGYGYESYYAYGGRPQIGKG